jgi:AmmeMemoRadiSam system protein A
MFTETQQRTLIGVAREAVRAAVTGREPGAPAGSDYPDATGAFVTLKKRGELRGCIVTLECRRPLAEEVARVAVSAALEDPRFAAVTPSELDDLDVEVSVLGPLEPIDPLDPSAIEIGRHGLVVEHGPRRGLLLPQVATEWKMDRETFLAHTCAKAGLPADCWTRGAKVYRFAADVFGD